MKKLLQLLFILFLLLLCFMGYQYRSVIFNTHKSFIVQSTKKIAPFNAAKLHSQAAQLKNFAQQNHYSGQCCFLIDMSLPCGKNRFFVYDLQHDSIKYAGLVAHGSGKKRFTAKPEFSNAVNSGCTSLGRYKISYKYPGRFGAAFKLDGLDTTNNNALQRNVVLHAYSCVPDNETYPLPICNSLGCPMVSHHFLSLLEKEIAENKKPVLLWVYE